MMATGPFRILVLDDEPAACALIGDELRRQGYDGTIATEPEQAIALLDGDPFDPVITDVSMPRLSGLDVLVHAKRKVPDGRVALITAHGTHDHIAQALFLGASDYVKKPFEAGQESPLGTRVIMTADCIDAMLMERTYKKGHPVEKMPAELTRCAGAQLDPKAAAAAPARCQSHREALFLPGKAAPARQEVA
jgi:response regulator RpfG family c-di-GMP phosphodiesterase